METYTADYDIPSSPETDHNTIFREAAMTATLAERFHLTQFQPHQKDSIQNAPDGHDTLIIQPTGSGKRCCFELPPVYQPKGIVIVPTISLM